MPIMFTEAKLEWTIKNAQPGQEDVVSGTWNIEQIRQTLSEQVTEKVVDTKLPVLLQQVEQVTT